MIAFIIGLILFIIPIKLELNDNIDYILSVIGVTLIFERSFDIHLSTLFMTMIFIGILAGMKKWSKLFQE